jgi:hypothetical protein
MTPEEQAARLTKRAPVTTSRTELLQLPTGWALLAVPSARVLETWGQDEEATARHVAGLVAALVATQRTCPRCASPLALGGWCDPCQVHLTPAGPRVGAEEQALRDRQKADAAAAVDQLRGKPPV